jgi:hypothetical protein
MKPMHATCLMLAGMMVRMVAASPSSPTTKPTIIREVLSQNRDGSSVTWFHPKACLIPELGRRRATSLMTMQSIKGSDTFGPVHEWISIDGGITWSAPKPILAFAQTEVPGHPGLRAGVCDVVPEYHPQSDTVLAIGQVVFYRGPRFSSGDQLPRYPIYAVRSRDGSWSGPQILHWEDPRGSFIYSNNCGQRVVLENGDILLAISFGNVSEHRSVATLRCRFDGTTLAIVEVGEPLHLAAGRGLLEPSLVRYKGRYYLTMRAEDGRGYLAMSRDGLHWSPKESWKWEDGQALELSSTQQHWLTHQDDLFLVYTRKTPENHSVIRWRAPLWMSRFNAENQRLVRDSEQVVLPMIGNGIEAPDEVALMGNFHVTTVSDQESWITVGEWLPRRDARGDLLLARVHWPTD